jgi:hypothetical protein
MLFPSPVRATYPSHFVLIEITLGLMTPGEEYEFLSSTVYIISGNITYPYRPIFKVDLKSLLGTGSTAVHRKKN